MAKSIEQIAAMVVLPKKAQQVTLSSKDLRLISKRDVDSPGLFPLLGLLFVEKLCLTIFLFGIYSQF